MHGPNEVCSEEVTVSRDSVSHLKGLLILIQAFATTQEYRLHLVRSFHVFKKNWKYKLLQESAWFFSAGGKAMGVEQNPTAGQVQPGDHQVEPLPRHRGTFRQSQMALKATSSKPSAAISVPQFPCLESEGVGLGGL